MLSKIKFKAIITIESLLEGETDKFILQRIMKSLSIEVLRNNLTYIYDKFTKICEKKYTEEVFKYSDIDPLKEPQNKLKSSLILECGFKIFIILRKYIEIESDKDIEFDLEEVSSLKSEFDIMLYIGENGTKTNIDTKLESIPSTNQAIEKYHSNKAYTKQRKYSVK